MGELGSPFPPTGYIKNANIFYLKLRPGMFHVALVDLMAAARQGDVLPVGDWRALRVNSSQFAQPRRPRLASNV